MSSSSRILAAVSPRALAATAAPLAGAANTPAPTLVKRSPLLIGDNEISQGTVAVAFRTDRALDRKSNGKSIDGRAGVKGHSNSLSTFAKAKPAYIAYVAGVSVSGGGEHLKVGHRYKVTISLGDREVTRTVKLWPNTKESAVRTQLGA
jgi:hypothetical protein